MGMNSCVAAKSLRTSDPVNLAGGPAHIRGTELDAS